MASRDPAPEIGSVDAVESTLAQQGYVCDRRLATVVFLSLRLQRPLFLEGEPGVGKTELAKVLAAVMSTPMLRIQCHEGLEISQAAYEWNVARQLLEIRLAEATHTVDRADLLRNLYSREMLIERPLLAALSQTRSPVLLIDEIDRADEPFDAYLLEVLAENQITIPEFGTVRALQPPITVITSNRTREVHDALKRRCLYHWLDYPDAARELQIVRLKVQQASPALGEQVVQFVQRLRRLELLKPPGVAETLDWTRALLALQAERLDVAAVHDTLGLLVKLQDDLARLDATQIERLLAVPAFADPTAAD